MLCCCQSFHNPPHCLILPAVLRLLREASHLPNKPSTRTPDTHSLKKGLLSCRHVEMLRDDMSLQKKEMQTARADIGNATAVTANIDGRFHMLESEMRSLWKKVTDDHDKAAADKPSPIMPVRIPPGHPFTVVDSCTLVHYSDGFLVVHPECLLLWCHCCSRSWRMRESISVSFNVALFPSFMVCLPNSSMQTHLP